MNLDETLKFPFKSKYFLTSDIICFSHNDKLLSIETFGAATTFVILTLLKLYSFVSNAFRISLDSAFAIFSPIKLNEKPAIF